MKKEAYYFSHDSNAKDDPKILQLRMEMGWEGYGLFWAIIEMLRNESDFRMRTHYKGIAFALQTHEDCIKKLINEFDLFELDEQYFWSESLLKRMELKEERSEKARESAKKRWNRDIDANAMRTHSERNADAMQLKESKVKEIKEKESKVNEDSHNAIFRQLWNNDIPIDVMQRHSRYVQASKHIDELEADLTAAREELVETRKDFMCLAELLDGHDATECRMNLVRLKQYYLNAWV